MEKGKLGTILQSRLDIPVKVKSQSWYKERLDSKYIRKYTDTSRWTFIKNGMDDYRDGNPPKLDDSILIKSNKGMKPSLIPSEFYVEKLPCQRIAKSLDSYDKLYSKRIPNQRKRMLRVKEHEESILKGPLSYSPEQNDLPDKVIQDISEILDLSRSKPMSNIYNSVIPADFDSMNNSDDSKEDSADDSIDEVTKRAYNLYKKQSSTLNASDELISEDGHINNTKPTSSEMDRVELVTKDFCDWVKGIGGEGNNVEEDTIKELFVCAYEGDPTTSVVQTMNLSTIPSELLADAHQSRDTCIKRNIASRGSTTSNSDKIKYGAWYLPPKTWKARPANTLLQDERKKEENPKPKKNRDVLDQALPSLHSAQTFLNFIYEKNYPRKPELLRNVELDENYLKLDKDHQTPLPSIVG